ncbi:MAG: insulinase family protein [Deltaproteobacteria bacterium]|nr:insulinase family protein [Deltaproteobacteria bacterium]MDQ3300651.1 insulinase family protein [Myxococcota bacterium]
MRRLLLTACAVALAPFIALVPAPAAAQAPPATPPPLATPAKPAPRAINKLPTIDMFELANGLRVAVLRTDAAPVVSVQLWYRAGSKDEPRNRRGSAHMFEHMMFKGTRNVRSESHAQFISGVGGYVNAQTDEDATHYINTLPADYLDFAIKLEAERMRNLLFRPDMIATEREVVKEEIRQQENSPIAKGFLRFLEVAFSKHPYAWTAGGNLRDLDATTPEDLKRFYDAYYQPNNALLVVVGKTTTEAVKAAAERHFGALAKAPPPPRPAAEAVEPLQTAKRREVVEPGQIGLALVGFHIPPAKHKDVYALQVASIILGAGESSRLKLRLKATDPKTKRPIALDGGMESIVREDPGMAIALGAYLDAPQGDAIEAAIFDELGKLGAKGPTPDELRKAKNQVQSGFVFSLENAQGLAQAIGRSWILTGDPGMFMRDVDEIEKIKAADVQRVVKQYMTPSLATVVIIPPKGVAAPPPAAKAPPATPAAPAKKGAN